MTPATGAPAFDVAAHPDRVEVRGVSGADVMEALNLLDMVRQVQAAQVAGSRDTLVHALMASNVSLMPPASLSQARRLATHRDALLASGVLTYATLQELRGDAKESSTRTWFSRKRAAHAIFAVSHGGRTLIPGFQLDQHGDPRTELQPLISTLLTAGVEGWALWTWLVSKTSLLSGASPADVARTAPPRALVAARRFAAQPMA